MSIVDWTEVKDDGFSSEVVHGNLGQLFGSRKGTSPSLASLGSERLSSPGGSPPSSSSAELAPLTGSNG